MEARFGLTITIETDETVGVAALCDLPRRHRRKAAGADRSCRRPRSSSRKSDEELDRRGRRTSRKRQPCAEATQREAAASPPKRDHASATASASAGAGAAGVIAIANIRRPAADRAPKRRRPHERRGFGRSRRETAKAAIDAVGRRAVDQTGDDGSARSGGAASAAAGATASDGRGGASTIGPRPRPRGCLVRTAGRACRRKLPPSRGEYGGRRRRRLAGGGRACRRRRGSAAPKKAEADDRPPNAEASSEVRCRQEAGEACFPQEGRCGDEAAETVEKRGAGRGPSLLSRTGLR